jgi:hypothetical protein
MKLPEKIGPLIGIVKEPSADELKMLPSDTTFAKMNYITAGAKPEDRDVACMSVVLAGAESRSIHRPEVCLPGQGWTIEGSSTLPITLPDGQILHVTDLSISGTFTDKAGVQRKRHAHFVYWFTGNDISTPSHMERIMRSTWDAVMNGVNHRWAYSSVLAVVTENEDPATVGERRRTSEETLRLISFIIREAVPQYEKRFMAKQPS